MAAIAQRCIGRGFAAAKEDLLGLRRFPFHWCDTRTLVRSVTDRLLRRSATGAPEVGLSGCDLCRERGLLGDDWGVGHVIAFLQWWIALAE
jgi:hypothetical protein